MVDLFLTVETRISHRALTEVTSFRVINTTAIVEARPVGAGTRTQLAIVAIETCWATALVSVVIVLNGREGQWK